MRAGPPHAGLQETPGERGAELSGSVTDGGPCAWRPWGAWPGLGSVQERRRASARERLWPRRAGGVSHSGRLLRLPSSSGSPGGPGGWRVTPPAPSLPEGRLWVPRLLAKLHFGAGSALGTDSWLRSQHPWLLRSLSTGLATVHWPQDTGRCPAGVQPPSPGLPQEALAWAGCLGWWPDSGATPWGCRWPGTPGVASLLLPRPPLLQNPLPGKPAQPLWAPLSLHRSLRPR